MVEILTVVVVAVVFFMIGGCLVKSIEDHNEERRSYNKMIEDLQSNVRELYTQNTIAQERISRLEKNTTKKHK